MKRERERSVLQVGNKMLYFLSYQNLLVSPSCEMVPCLGGGDLPIPFVRKLVQDSLCWGFNSGLSPSFKTMINIATLSG